MSFSLPTAIALRHQRILRALGSIASHRIDERRGFSLTQWPSSVDNAKPFELSMEHEARLLPPTHGSESAISAALELCEGRLATMLLGKSVALADLFVQLEPRPAGAQSADIYYDLPVGQPSLIDRGFTVRERVRTAAFMTWGTTAGGLRAMNAEFPSSLMGTHGLSARLEFNWREPASPLFADPLPEHHPLLFLSEEAGFRPSDLRPALLHTTVRRKYNFVDAGSQRLFVLNIDHVKAVRWGTDASEWYTDVDLSALRPVTEATAQRIDEIAHALSDSFGLAPNQDTKASRSLRAGTPTGPVVALPARRRQAALAASAGGLNIGIIGPGRVADRWLAPAIQQTDGCRLWSVAGRNVDQATTFAAKHSAAARRPVRSTIADFLGDSDLHAVVVTTPDALHAEHTLAAVRAGRHVFCEKPLVTDLESGFALWAEARSSGVIIAVGYHLRWHPAHVRIAELIRSGAIGDVRYARGIWANPARDPTNWRSGRQGSCWWAAGAYGTHILDLLRWLLLPTCGEVVRVRHMRSNAAWLGDNDETTLSDLEFANGAMVEAVASVTIPPESRLEIHGEKARIVCEGTLAQEMGGRLLIDGCEVPLPPSPAGAMYKSEIEDFVAAIREGRYPAANVVEGLRNVQLLGDHDQDSRL